MTVQDMDSLVESGDEKCGEHIKEKMQLKLLSPGIKKVVMHLIAEDSVRNENFQGFLRCHQKLR